MKTTLSLITFWLVFLSELFRGSFAVANEHKKGTSKRQAPSRQAGTTTSPEAQTSADNDQKLPSMNCYEDWSAPVGGSGYFDKISQYYYQIANIGAVQKRKRGASLNRYGIFQIDVESARSNPLMTMKLPAAEAVIPFGANSLDAIIAFVFNAPESDCINGRARFIGFPISKGKKSSRRNGKLSVIQGRGLIQLVSTPGYPVAYDGDKKALLEFDFTNLQSRSMLLRLGSNEIPVYYDVQRRRYYAWHFMDEKRQRGLIAYDGGGKVAGRLLFHGGDKLLQQKNFFGVIRQVPADNSLTIIELKRWSGQGEKKSYSIHIPKEYPVLSSSVRVHFSKKLAVISAFKKDDRKRWNKTFVYDYEKSWQLSVLTAPASHYIAHETISDDGKWVMAEIRNKNSDITSTLGLFSTQTRKWVQIPIVKKR